MQYASITAFLSGTLRPEALAILIGAEVVAYRTSLQETSTGYVRVTDGPEFSITREGARLLLTALANEQLSFDEASYVADCLVLHDNFDFADDATRDAIFFLEDDTGRFVTEDDSWRPTREETLAALGLLD